MNSGNRRNFIKGTLAAGISAFVSADALKAIVKAAHHSLFRDEQMDSQNIIAAPDDPAAWPAWRDALTIWKKNKLVSLSYDGSSYRSGSFQWVSSDFACCFIMMCDSAFYDHSIHDYKIEQLIGEGKLQFGGYDSVVLWHAYPRIGLDDRNQYDFYREMPGGLSGINKVVRQFHQNNIRVFIDYNPWDTGTRRDPKTDIEVLVDIITETEADGIFLDTMKDAPDFRQKLDEVRPGIVLEGEIALPLEHIQSHHMSWAQGFADSRVPGVYRNKWFERHHMQHAIDRWNIDKTAQLHTAWMNGSGMLIWENVFGQWLGWTNHDKALYRTMYMIQHHFADLFTGEGWTPLSVESPISSVYVSSWQTEGIKLWTVVNRNEFPVEGVIVRSLENSGLRYFDLVKGEEITDNHENGMLSLSGSMVGRGIACFISLVPDKIDEEFRRFLTSLRKLFQLTSDDLTMPVRNNQLVRPKEYVLSAGIPDGMVMIPPADLTLKSEYTFREPGGYGNIQEYLMLAKSHNLHSVCTITRKVVTGKFAIDETPVTNIQFSEFIGNSGYRPLIHENFLKHWVDGKIPTGKEEHPVVYISMEDALAFARWAGKRLPTENEWQIAAQGFQGLVYPWGNVMEANKCNPNTNMETTEVKAFPEGVSPFGCYDMCGNTWELTNSEYGDGRTRFVMLKGGSCYKARGSVWYMDGGPQKNSFIAKMLLMWPGLDRCSTVGFRCALDL